MHPSGITGVSVECAADLSVAELADRIPHGQVGVTTARAVRAAGGDVIRTSRRSAHHESSQMDKPQIFADFHNADHLGRLRLNCAGTLRDLADQGVQLNDGLAIEVYSEDLSVAGCARYAPEERLWGAVIDWADVERQPT